MSLVQRLQMLAEERKTNFKQIEKACGIGNGTMRRWDESFPRFDIIKKVADYLQVSLDFLADGIEPIRPKLYDTSGELISDDETELVIMYRSLDSIDREIVIGVLTKIYEGSLKKRGLSPSENTGTGA